MSENFVSVNCTPYPVACYSGIEIKNDGTYAVLIRNLCKRYGNGSPVLDKLDMTVEKGTIYGLLGSSGCGKTTTIHCMLGLEEWESGEITVLGSTPGTVVATKRRMRLGYMPQELALYGELTVEEIFRFYGKLYNMTSQCISERWNFLKKLLEFPANLGLLKDTSGGQQRRASLALAMLHNPELLILDEPTVGLDPLLRQKIWSYMQNIVKTQNITILITTHYIEEARFSDKIGVMRKGKLIAEDSPTYLLEMYNCEALEQVVLRLCYEDEQKLKKHQKRQCSTKLCSSMNNNLSLSYDNQNLSTCKTKAMILPNDFSTCTILQHLERVAGLITVLTLSFIRNPAFLGALMILPSIQSSLAIAALGAKVQNVPLGIVNHVRANCTTECASGNSTWSSCNLNEFSCDFINQLREDDFFLLTAYDSEQQALEHAHLGEIMGYLVFPSNYSVHILNLALENKFAINSTLEGSRVRVRLDQSDFITALLATKHLFKGYLASLNILAISCGFSQHGFQLPLQFLPPVYGDYSDNYVEYMLPGNIIFSLYCVSGLLSGLMFVADYKQGTLRRTRLAGLTTADIIISHLSIQVFICLIQTALFTGFCYFVFDWSIHGSLGLYILVCLLTGLFGTSFGLFLGVTCRSEVGGLIVSTYTFLVFYLFGGANFPTETTTWLWQMVGYIVAPVKTPVAALRSILIRQLPLSHSLVWTGLVVYGFWILLFIVGFIILIKILKL